MIIVPEALLAEATRRVQLFVLRSPQLLSLENSSTPSAHIIVHRYLRFELYNLSLLSRFFLDSCMKVVARIPNEKFR